MMVIFLGGEGTVWVNKNALTYVIQWNLSKMVTV